MKSFISETQRKGKSGEEVAAMILQKLNFTILERNYTKRVGELDIIALKGSQIYFFEVKKSLYSTYNPLQNITNRKLNSFRKTAYLYLAEKRLLKFADYSIGAISIHLKGRLLFVEIYENI